MLIVEGVFRLKLAIQNFVKFAELLVGGNFHENLLDVGEDDASCVSSSIYTIFLLTKFMMRKIRSRPRPIKDVCLDLVVTNLTEILCFQVVSFCFFFN